MQFQAFQVDTETTEAFTLHLNNGEGDARPADQPPAAYWRPEPPTQ
jgi:hypothetical protein